MTIMKILPFLILGFIVHANSLRCHRNGPSGIIDCPMDANDVCATGYCADIPDEPGMTGVFWINNCISGFDKESACKALDEKFCNKPGGDPNNFWGCEICSKDECNAYGFEDEPEWRKTNQTTKFEPKTTPNFEPVQTTQIEHELVKSTLDPAPTSIKKEPESTTSTADDSVETNNAIHLFNIGYTIFFNIY